VRVIAVSGGKRADVVRFTRQRFGSAPVRVYFDPSGRTQAAFKARYHPTYRFVNARGKVVRTPPSGFPIR
jgi:hypothetical protein